MIQTAKDLKNFLVALFKANGHPTPEAHADAVIANYKPEEKKNA